MRIPQNREATLRLYVDDEDGTLVAATGTPTVTITNGAGTAIVTGAASTNEATGIYKYTLTPQSSLDVLTVVWSYVVGGFTRTLSYTACVTGFRLVPLYRFREDQELASVTGTRLRRISDAVEDAFMKALGFPAVVEGKRVSFVLDEYSPTLYIPGVSRPHSLISLTVGSTVQDVSGVSVRDGGFVKASGASWSPGVYSAWVTHGLSSPSERLIEVGIVLGRYIARQNNYPERALRVVSNDTEITFAMTGDPDHPTGLPEVDTVLTSERDQFVI